MKNWNVIFTFCLMFGMGTLHAQDEKAALHRLWQADSTGISAIAMYPPEVRKAILLAATRPGILVRMGALREDAATDYREILKPYDRADQERLYQLTRFPDLVQQLGEGGKMRGQELDALLENYPEEVREDLAWCNRKLYPAVLEIYGLNLDIEAANLDLLAPYPMEVQNAYSELLQYPEVMEILAGNLEMTILIGDIYQKDEAWVGQKLDSMNLELARTNAENLEAWKKEMENDPEAMADFQRAAADYASESGYTEEEYAKPRTEVVYVDRYIHSYSYWYGYPWWYQYPVWYPRPWWQDWGYYYGPGGAVVFIGLPSWHFCRWYYQRPYHHYYYPNFTNLTVNYYYGHRKSVSSLASGVRKLENDTRQYYKKDWIKDSNRRKDLIQSYGEIELNYAQSAATRPQTVDAKSNYIRAEVQSNPKTKAYAAPLGKPVTIKAAPKPKPGYVVPDRQVVTPRPQAPRKPIYTKPRLEVKPQQPTKYQQINRAKDFHKGSWTQPRSKPARPPASSGKVKIKRR